MRHRTVVTRSTSAAEVMPARHFAMASSIIVVMPAARAALSMTTPSARTRIELADRVVHFQHLEHALAAAIAGAAATLAADRLADDLAGR